MKAIIHIGSEKTGSTSLQSVLLYNRAVLERVNILYGIGGQDCLDVNDYNLAMCLAPPNLRDRYIPAAERSRRLSVMKTYLRGISNKDGRIILSSECFHSRFTEESNIRDLKDLLSDSGIEVDRIIVYFRPQSSLARAAYSTQIRFGRRAAFNVNEMFELRHYYDHLNIADKWSAIFGQDKLHIRSYADGIDKSGFDILEDFISALDCDSLLSVSQFDRKYEIRNRSLGPMYLEVLRNVDERIGNKQRFIEMLEQMPRDIWYDNFIKEDISRIDETYGPRNVEMCLKYGLDINKFRAVLPSDLGDRTHILRAELSTVALFSVLYEVFGFALEAEAKAAL